MRSNKLTHKNIPSYAVLHAYDLNSHTHPLSSNTTLTSETKRLVTKPHHARSYRKRHFSILTLALVLLVFLLLQVGVIIGANRRQPFPQQSITRQQPASFTLVRSDYGFGLDFDSNTFVSTATAIDEKGVSQPVGQDDLAKSKQLNLVSLRPRKGFGSSRFSSSQLSLQVLPTTTELAALKKQPASAGLSDSELAAQLFPVSSSADFDVAISSTSSDIIAGGTLVTKKVYQFTPKFSGGLSYAVVWTGVVNDRPFALKMSGLVANSSIPDIFIPVFDSLRINSSQKVQGASTFFTPKAAAATANVLDSKYVADLVSPAVVKIYHIICGQLIIFDHDYGKSCDGGTGSGFLVSANGYIATNGHVAVYTAKDIAVGIIIKNPDLFVYFLQNVLHMTNSQISAAAQDPQVLGSLIAKIYDTTDAEIRIDNLKETTLVALGGLPVDIKSRDDLLKLTSAADTANIKKARLIAADYNAKDLITVGSGNPGGFTSSDVALLKIDITNAPLIRINTNPINQNQKISVFGFPGDAENALIDNKSLDVSVTNGVISSTREAAGGKSKLYQSDVDASHGNSGGPALTEDGSVFGLLTYRIAGDASGNAAKSYLRDIKDFQKLVTAKNINFSSTSQTQDAWGKGLDLYSKNHYSAALIQFNKVRQLYPEHRLAATYIDNSNKQIADGKDVKDFPVLILVAGLVVVILLIAGTVVAIVSHARHHRSYVLQNAFPAVGEPLAQGTPQVSQLPENHHQNSEFPETPAQNLQPSKNHHQNSKTGETLTHNSQTPEPPPEA